MKKIILFTLLASVLLSCTACKKQQTEMTQETTMTENLPTQSEMTTSTNINTDSELETKSATTTKNNNSESNTNSTTSSINITNLPSSTAPTITETIEPTESPLQLKMQEALQNAIDEEEQQAIQAVQPETESKIYYENTYRDFKKENFPNLDMLSTYTPQKLTSSNGSNIHKYFFEAKPISGTNLLQMQKLASSFANIDIAINKITSNADTLENAEYLLYNSDSLYLRLQDKGECILYRPDEIQKFTGEENLDNWNPLANSTNLGRIGIPEIRESAEKWGISTNGRGDMESFDVMIEFEQEFYLNGQKYSLHDFNESVYYDIEQLRQNECFSSVYSSFSFQDCELLEFPNSGQAIYITLKLISLESNLHVNSTQKSAFLDNQQKTCPQTIKILMFDLDSIAYMELPTTLTQEPDTIETLDNIYCSLSDACTIISDYLTQTYNQDYIYHVLRFSISYQTLLLYQNNQYLGMVQAPMYHFTIDNLPDDNQSVLYADIALDTKQLYISYS